MSQSTEDTLTFLRKLRAVKEYTEEPVSEQMINDILEVGRWTGSGTNKQPWEFLIIRDADVKEKLGDWGAKPAATAGVVILIASANDIFAAFDEGRLAERIALAAAAHNLGSTVATLKNDGPDQAKALLGIPTDRRVKTLVAIGHPDLVAHQARPKHPQARKPMNELAHWDRY